MSQAINSVLYFALLGLLCGVVSFRLGWRIGGRITLPLIQTLLGFLAFAASWRAGGSIAAAFAAGGWAVGTSLVGVGAFARDPQRAVDAIVGAQNLRRSTFEWIRRGRGPRSGPGATVSRLVRLLSVFLIAAGVSAGALALGGGALMLNAQNASAAALLAGARRPEVVRWLAWNVWSAARVVAFTALGSACAAPVATWLGYPPDPQSIRLLLIVGVVAVATDLALELTLSEAYRRVLSSAVAPDPTAPASDAGRVPLEAPEPLF